MNVRKNSTRSPITLAAYVTAIAAIAALLAARARNRHGEAGKAGPCQKRALPRFLDRVR